ncbi:hypothetical protein Gotur_028081 [Gossypium turneri]
MVDGCAQTKIELSRHWKSPTKTIDTWISESDTSHKGPTQAQERDGLKLPQGPITRSKARQMCMELNETVQDFISKALDVYTKQKENQDSLSCFQENQETES